MRFDVLTLFPEIFLGYLTQSILKLALERGLVEIHLWNIRDWAQGKHRSVDDRPFGGGPGMLGDADSVTEESHSDPGRLEYPQYTRPRVFRDMAVPEVLLSGNHQAIARWRSEQSEARTRLSREVQGAGPVESESNKEKEE